MDYFPVFLDLRGKRCLVVGGGDVASRKVQLLLRAQALVHVVAPNLSASMHALLGHAALRHEARAYEARDLRGVVVVVAATDDRDVNAQVSRDAGALRLPVNVVDDPALCTFIMPAFVERASVLIAIGTGGSAPVLARLLRGRIEAAVPERYGDLVELCGKLRAVVQERLPDVTRRRRFWEEVLEGAPSELVFRGELLAAEAAMLQALAQSVADTGAMARLGEAYLIGVGPNDPELVSFRALRMLQRAELVLHGESVAEAIVMLSRRDAHRVAFSGGLDAAADGVVPRMAAAVASGQRVCVLACGDTFREPEGRRFAQRALAAGLECQVVPGIA